MFIGHIAVALAAKCVAPTLPLRTALVGTVLPDLVWPVLVLAGVEHVEIAPGDTAFVPLRFVSYPWSHSLLMVTLTGALVGGLYAWRTRNRSSGMVFALLAISHWVLDWISHRTDMPLMPGGAVHGLGLWQSVPATLLAESGLFLLGTLLYAHATVARDRTGTLSYWSLIVLLAAAYTTDRFSPPPPSAAAVAWMGILLGVVLFAWATWIERHRSLRS
ncbi:MAG: hypothetical protein C0502_10345 [Opitutus sp.]|nr:hypothetical protein [Opitutus sp.]